MTATTRRAMLAAGAVLALPIARISAQPAWPSGPIKIICPFPPGGSTDAVARLAATQLQATLGVPVVVENRSGAAGSIGTGVVAKAAPDGNTWLLTFDSHPTLPALLPNLPFDIQRDFAPVMLIGGAPYVLATRPDSAYGTLRDVINAARKDPESVSFSSSGNGTIGHLMMVLIAARNDVRLTHIAYRGAGPAIIDTIAGNVGLVVGSAAALNPHIAGGKLRAVVQMGEARLPALANVPTLAESGQPGLAASGWWGVLAPAGTPKPVMTRFHAALVAAFEVATVRDFITNTQQARLVLSSPEAFGTFIEAETATWGKVVRDNSIQAD